jgi:hypothetical protein
VKKTLAQAVTHDGRLLQFWTFADAELNDTQQLKQPPAFRQAAVCFVTNM